VARLAARRIKWQSPAVAPDNDDPLSRLAAELDDLRVTTRQLREAVVSRDNAAANAPGISAALLLAQRMEAKLTAFGATMGLVRRQTLTLEAGLERSEREACLQKVKRAEVAARLADRERRLKRIEGSGIWKSVKPLWKLLNRSRRQKLPTQASSSDLAFGLEAPTQWKISGEILLIKGWCLSRGGREIAGIRAKIGKKGRLGRYGLARPNLAFPIGRASAALHSGFTIEMPVPAGVSTVRLEAIVHGGDWEAFFEHQIEREGTDAEAAADLDPGRGASQENELPQLPALSARSAFDLLAPRFRIHVEQVSGRSPFISVLTPSYNSKPQWLAEAAITLLHQSFTDWEWCIVDDGSDARETKRLLEQLTTVSPRLRIKFIANHGISTATNEALDLATGEFVCLLDHDDLLDANALREMEKKLRAGFDVVYSDEDKLDDTTRQLVEQFYKPDWSPEYFRGVMYVGHLLCVRRDLAKTVRFDPAFDGVQDFEFMLRLSETEAKIGHIPRVLYHWRKTPGSLAAKIDAKPEAGALQERAVNMHLQRLGLPARAESKLPHRLRIVPARGAANPLVSVIIPTKDAPELLSRCLESLYEKTSYAPFEVVLVDNGTTNADALSIMKQYPLRRIDLPGPFNFSRANNRGVEQAAGASLVFLNNDTEIVTADWLQHLLYYAEQTDVGAAGALLAYPNRTVQHAGVALGMQGTADHTMRGFPIEVEGYAGSLACAREVSAVTAACMMIRKSLFLETGAFNEHFFTAYQDLDLCLRLRARGLRIIHTPEAVVVHHESASRMSYYDMVDRMLLLDQWEPAIDRGDPYYNPNLSLERGDYSPAGR